MNRTETIAKYAAMMMELPYSVGEAPDIYLKHDGRIYCTADGADFRNITERDVLDITSDSSLEKDVLKESRDINALIVCATPYLSICMESGREIPAVLDDMAQIVGQKVRIVPYRKRPVASALGSASAVMVQGKYALCAGRNLYEAYTVMTVLEKSAEVILKAMVIGGARPLGAADCRIQRMFYRRKYSKAEKEHKDDTEG